MDDVVEFFNSYLDVVHAGEVAIFSEPDEIVVRLQGESLEFWHAEPGAPVSPPFGRIMGLSSAQLAQKWAGRPGPEISRRTLFLIAEYNSAEWGALFAGYIGGDRKLTASAYGGLLYATDIAGEFKIIASYREDIEVVPPPLQWRYSRGAHITLANTPVAVRPLEEPTGRAAHRQDWQEMQNSAPTR